MTITLWNHIRSNEYFYTGNPECVKCGMDCFPTGIIVIKHPKNRPTETLLYCQNHSSEIKHSEVIEQWGFVHICKEPPKDCVPVITTKPDLVNSKSSLYYCWDAADEQEEGVVVNDYTVLSGKESWIGSQIGVEPNKIIEKYGDKRKQLTIAEADSFLEDMKNAEPLIEDKTKKRLKHGLPKV